MFFLINKQKKLKINNIHNKKKKKSRPIIQPAFLV